MDEKQHIARLEAQIEVLKSLIVDMKQEQTATTNTPEGSVLARMFTTKQHATIQMLHVGYSNPQIADKLGCAESTVKVHIKAIMDKLGVRTRQQVVIKTQEIMNLSDDAYLSITAIPRDWHENGGTSVVDAQIKTKTR